MHELPDWVKPGASFKLDYGAGNINNAKYHVRAVVDGLAVLRQWSTGKQRWFYSTEWPSFFHVNADHIGKIEAVAAVKGDDRSLAFERSVLACPQAHTYEAVRMAGEAVLNQLDALDAAAR